MNRTPVQEAAVIFFILPYQNYFVKFDAFTRTPRTVRTRPNTIESIKMSLFLWYPLRDNAKIESSKIDRNVRIIFFVDRDK